MQPRARSKAVEYGVLAALVGAALAGPAWWRDREAARLGNEVAALARPGDIEMVSSVTCVYCDKARAWLSAHGAPFSECYIERDAACMARYEQLGAAGTPTFLIKGRLLRGYSAPAIVEALRRPALQAAPAPR
jgi:glutaredoxin